METISNIGVFLFIGAQFSNLYTFEVVEEPASIDKTRFDK